MPIRIGYWYDVIDPNNKICQVKLIPSEPYLENQDSKINYFEVLERKNNNAIVSGIIGEIFECKDYIITHYTIKDNFSDLTDRLWSVKEELETDQLFLKKMAGKKFHEIVYHIQDALELIDRLEDYYDNNDLEETNG